jgi:(4S)-4-hydroxy-5-phosphonooxypentane-2,3-dione isomerase
MHIALVHIHIKPEFQKEFELATLENVRNSVLEEGIVRFDFMKNQKDPSSYTLYEVYKTPEDQLKHRETKHYLTWKDAVAEMMAEPRQGILYHNIYPEDAGWK